MLLGGQIKAGTDSSPINWGEIEPVLFLPLPVVHPSVYVYVYLPCHRTTFTYYILKSQKRRN